MKIQRLLVTLTVVNCLLLAFLLAQTQAVSASPESSVLRGRALEIVDDRGRVRASIKIHPADASFRMPDGSKGHPEAVLFRLITPDGKPGIKVAASEQGAGILVMGEGQGTYARVVAEGKESKLELLNKDGKPLTLKP